MKPCSSKFLVCLFIGFFIPFSCLFSAQKKILLDFAKKYYLQGKIARAEDKVNTVLTDYPDDPTANILHGLVLLHKGNVEDRFRAYEIIQKYSRKQRNDPFTQYSLGILYKVRKSPEQARKHFEKAVKLDSQFVEALVELGDYHFREMMKYYNRITDTSVPLSLREYAIEDYDWAVHYLQRALTIEPFHKRALYLLGSLYYEMEEFREMIKLFSRALEEFPRDKDMNLFLGLAHLSLHQYEEANRYFQTAMQEMSETERALFSDPLYLIKKDKARSSPDAGNSQFWQAKDPLFLTEENERLLEHYGRVAYANLRFGVPALGIEGWQTDRGKTYIRYGKPLEIIEFGKSMSFNVIYSPMQIWIYPQFRLAFTDEFWNGHYQFTQPVLGSKSRFKERTNIDYSMVAQDVYQVLPETFDFQLSGGTFESPYRITFFRKGEETEAQLDFGLPVPEESNRSRLAYRAGIFLLDQDRLPVFQLKESLKLDYRKNRDRLVGRYLINTLKFCFTPGDYPYSFELIDLAEDRNFVDRQSLRIPDFRSDSLMLSDLLLAYVIRPSRREGPFTRNGFFILPNIRQSYSPGENLFLYFEIYNLQPDGSGKTHYVVENSVVRREKRGIIKTLLGKKPPRVTIVNEYSGRETSDFVIQSLDPGNLEPGEYELEIKVKDEISKKETHRTTRFRISGHLTD